MLNSSIRVLAKTVTHRLRSVIVEALARPAKAEAETSAIKINKPYKPRILKNDLAHRMARQVYKMKARNPAFKRKAKIYRKKYLQKNGRNLKMRSQRVREIRKDRGLND
jgi:hypothetical protein